MSSGGRRLVREHARRGRRAQQGVLRDARLRARRGLIYWARLWRHSAQASDATLAVRSRQPASGSAGGSSMPAGVPKSQSSVVSQCAPGREDAGAPADLVARLAGLGAGDVLEHLDDPCRIRAPAHGGSEAPADDDFAAIRAPEEHRRAGIHEAAAFVVTGLLLVLAVRRSAKSLMPSSTALKSRCPATGGEANAVARRARSTPRASPGQPT
jgi:hypothetical protein